MTISNLQLIALALRVLVPVVLIAAVGWFAWKANQMNKNPLAWGLLAAAAYLIPSKLVRALVTYLTDGIVKRRPFLVQYEGRPVWSI